MPETSRLLDEWTGICCCHDDPTCVSTGGWIITGSPNVFSGSWDQGRLSDTTIGYCGHTGIVVTGSSNTFENGLSDARIGDEVTGCNIGQVISGNPTHIVGG